MVIWAVVFFRMLTYDYVLRGHKQMARVKGREPVTFSVSPELLVLVDAHAQTVGLDRYDVMRLAIAKGVLVMRVEHELLMDADGAYTTAMLKVVCGEDTQSQLAVIEDGVLKGLQRDVPGGPNSVKRRRKAKEVVTDDT
jgi:hypothetical protein